MAWYKMAGAINYDPDRKNMKDRTQWWAVASSRNMVEIVRYYRWWLDREWWEYENQRTKRRYHPPSWGAHVTIARGEVPKNPQFWKAYQGEVIEMEYESRIIPVRDLGFRDKFFMIRVRSPRIMEIREELGLSNFDSMGRPYEAHLTIARIDVPANKTV